MTPKKLRRLYNTDAEARAFLAKHPEFRDSNFATANVEPKSNKTEDLTRSEPRPDRKHHSELIQSMIPFIPYPKSKKILTLYYSGLPYSQIAKRMGYKHKFCAYKNVHKAKKIALGLVKKPLKINRDMKEPPSAIKTLEYRGMTKTLLLVYDKISRDYVWIREDTGQALPIPIQTVLDREPGIMEWDALFL